MTTKPIKNQSKPHVVFYTEDGNQCRLNVTIRYDDRCSNGHNTFSITANGYEKAGANRWRDTFGGCCHDEIVKRCPELKHLIKWHLCSSDGPLHYIANTVYHAGDKDCNGLAKGEEKQIRNGRTGELCWKQVVDKDLPDYIDSDTQPKDTATVKYVPWCRIGEGKERELDRARSSAIWPDATDAELTSPDLEQALINRLPVLMTEFEAVIESLGFTY